MTARKTHGPRKAATYRAARRNWAIHQKQMNRQRKRKALAAYERAQTLRTPSVCRPGYATARVIV